MSEDGRRKISDRVVRAASQAVKKAADPRRARRTLGTQLIVGGLTAVCLAGGIDYFQNAEAIKQAVAGVARETGHLEFAATVDEVDRTVEGAKHEAASLLPAALRENLSLLALAGGVALLVCGTRVRVAAADEPGRALRDVGRVVAAPGFVGLLAFTALALESARLRTALGSFGRKLWAGEFRGQDLWAFALKYAPWTYEHLAGVLYLGLGLLAASGATCLARFPRRGDDAAPGPWLGFVRRLAAWAGLLCLGYYALATVATIASYASALSPYLTWPWKLTPGSFLTAIGFMSCGLALAQTGGRLLKRAQRTARAEATGTAVVDAPPS
ncbi:MAG: hypothetical protein D6731_12250 [Planctomycetota bacterium]|nr:MAG: hypothetical protein D6731_12250 [Planctomycetota bacterium]